MAQDDIDWSQSQNVSSYPDMTPGMPPQPAAGAVPKPVTVMDKTWRPAPPDPSADAPARIRQAMWEAWNEAPNLLTPEAEDWAAKNMGWLGRNVVPAVSHAVGTGLGDVAAAGTGIVSTLAELGGGLARDPSLTRDISAMPAALAGLPVDMPAPAVVARDFPRVPPEAQPRDVPASIMPSYTQPIVQARQADRAAQGGLLGNVTTGPTEPTGIQGPMPPPPGYTPPPNVVTTVQGAKDVTSQWAAANRTLAGQGGAVPASAFDRMYRSLQDEVPVPGPGQVFDKANPLPGFLDELQQYKGQPMSLVQAQDLYRRMGNFVSSQYTNQGLSDVGQAVLNAQQDLRGDISQSTGPNDPWSNMRQSWTQAMKMQDLQSIAERAMNTNNPAQSIQNQVASMLRNSKATRGWSDDELAMLKTIPDSSLAGDLLRGAASRLVPAAAGTATGVTLGALFGPAAAFAGVEGGQMMGELVRRPIENIRRNVALGKLDDALRTLGQGVPQPPPTGWSAPP